MILHEEKMMVQILLQALECMRRCRGLGGKQNSALVELLDEHDDPDYLQGAHVRHVRIYVIQRALGRTERCASTLRLVTPLPTTARITSANFMSYLTIAVPRALAPYRGIQYFFSTSDNSGALWSMRPWLDITDVDCRAHLTHRLSTCAPDGRFLACFTDEVHVDGHFGLIRNWVLNFDTSEGSSSPSSR
jgi:hypothetical protein